MDHVGRRRAGVLAICYAALLFLAYLAFVAVRVHLGALAVIPILFIAYYLRPYAALVTAFVTGVILGLLDQGDVVGGYAFQFAPFADAAVLSTALCVIVLVANRLRDMATANEVLHGRLVKARRDAEHDPLTDIPNRAYFLRRMQDAIKRDGARVAVLFCDLDRFKNVNDAGGHVAGDQVLRLAAGRLVNAVRAMDTVARIGGDEFAILVERVSDADEAMHIVRSIEHAFIEPFQLQDQRYAVGITAGVSFYPADETRAEALLQIADARMYRAKNEKRAKTVN